MGELMSFSPDAIANYFLEKAEAANEKLSPMKLQKLMYFAHGWHLALEVEGRALVSEPLEAWAYGPVFPSVYRTFKKFGNRPITEEALSTEYGADGSVSIIAPTVESEGAKDPSKDVTFAKAVMDRIWHVYGRYPAARLSDMTHEAGSPWSMTVENAKKRFQGQVPQGLEIPDEMIRDWFKTRFRTPAVSKAVAV
jgi:uncharacterized phage-associated protein